MDIPGQIVRMLSASRLRVSRAVLRTKGIFAHLICIHNTL